MFAAKLAALLFNFCKKLARVLIRDLAAGLVRYFPI